MSKFSLVHESADSDLDQVAETQPDANTAGVVEAVMEEHAAMLEAEASADTLADDYEKAGDLKEEVELAQEGVLSPIAARLLRQSLIKIAGKGYAAARLPAMESFDSRRDQVEATRIALEGIAQTLKDFWTAIKNQVTKFWNASKQWFIKTLDGSNKIIARAKALGEKADSMQGTAKEKSFELSGASLISINYQTKDANALIKGFEVLQQTVDGNLVNISKSNTSDRSTKIVEDMRRLMHTARNRATDETGEGSNPIAEMDKALARGLSDEQAANPLKPEANTVIQRSDEVYKQVVGDVNSPFVLKAGEQFSGSRRLYEVSGVDADQQGAAEVTSLDSIKALRVVVAPVTAKPKEMEDAPDVQTLNNGQVSKIADIAGGIGETVLKFKKEFEARDRYYNQLLKGLDQIAKEMEGDLVNTAMEAADGEKPAPAAAPAQPAPAAAPTQPAQPTTPAPATDNQQSTVSQPKNKNDNTLDVSGEKLKKNQAIDKYARKFVAAWAGTFRKEISLSGSLLTHSMKVCNVFLTYGERSVAQYGS